MTAIHRIKMPANVEIEVTSHGYLKAHFVFDELMKNAYIAKKNENVVESIENLLYNGHPIVGAKYDLLTNEILLEVEL